MLETILAPLFRSRSPSFVFPPSTPYGLLKQPAEEIKEGDVAAMES